jgi:hypothetical protein
MLAVDVSLTDVWKLVRENVSLLMINFRLTSIRACVSTADFALKLALIKPLKIE